MAAFSGSMGTEWGSDYWHVAVFCSARATGNPTGIVIAPEPISETHCWRVAALMGLPDTAFLWPDVHGVWRSQTFSPAEPISFCVQTLLASYVVLNRIRPEERYLFRVGGRTIEVRGDPRYRDTAWVEVPRADIRILGESDLGGLSTDLGFNSGTTIDAGRRRVYVGMSMSHLESVRLQPDDVLSFCRSKEIHGVCLFAVERSQTCALRVFTTSLDGREDSATGGAVLGLLTLLEATGHATRHADEVWTIDQGRGPRHLRGTLLACGSSETGLQIGGGCVPLARGKMLDIAAAVSELR